MRRFFLIFLIFVGQGFCQDACPEIADMPSFPSEYVNKVLDRFQIPGRSWFRINQRLTARSQNIDEIVRDKAKKLERNPFDAPEQGLVIGRLHRDTEVEILTEVLKLEGIEETRKIYEIYYEIKNQKAQAVWDCYIREQYR